LQLVAIGLWIRSGCTTEVARALAGVSSMDFDRWMSRGREDYGNDTPSIYADLVRRIELADALRRGEVLRAIHLHVLRNPDRAIDYIAKRWPDALSDPAISTASAPSAVGSLVDQVLDVAAQLAAADGGQGEARQLEPVREGDGSVVGDEPADPHDGGAAPAGSG
jgi:hypothetical protein